MRPRRAWVTPMSAPVRERGVAPGLAAPLSFSPSREGLLLRRLDHVGNLLALVNHHAASRLTGWIDLDGVVLVERNVDVHVVDVRAVADVSHLTGCVGGTSGRRHG